MRLKVLLLGCIALGINFIYTQGATTKSKSQKHSDDIIQDSSIFEYGLKEMNFICMKAYLAALRFLEVDVNRHGAYLKVQFDQFKHKRMNDISELDSSRQLTTDDIKQHFEANYKNHPNDVVTLIGKIFKGFISKNMKDFQRHNAIKTIEDYVKTSVEFVVSIFKTTTTGTTIAEDVLTKLHKHCMALETIWHLCRIKRYHDEEFHTQLMENFFAKIFKFKSKSLPQLETMKRHWEIVRDNQINAYQNVGGKQFPNLSDYLLECGDLCGEYENDIKGPALFNVAYQQQKNKIVDGAFRSSGYAVHVSYLKRTFFMHNRYDDSTISVNDETSLAFIKWISGLLTPHFNFEKTMKPAEETDATLLFLSILQKSKLNFCFKGAVINFFSLLNKYTLNFLNDVKAIPKDYITVLLNNEKPTIERMHPFDLFNTCVGSKVIIVDKTEKRTLDEIKKEREPREWELYTNFATLLARFDNKAALDFWSTYEIEPTDTAAASSSGTAEVKGKFTYPIVVVTNSKGRMTAREVTQSGLTNMHTATTSSDADFKSPDSGQHIPDDDDVDRSKGVPRIGLTRTNAFRGNRKKPNIPSSPHFGKHPADAGGQPVPDDDDDGDRSEDAPRRELTRANAFRGDRIKPNIPSSPHFGTHPAGAGGQPVPDDGDDGDRSEDAPRRELTRTNAFRGDRKKPNIRSSPHFGTHSADAGGQPDPDDDYGDRSENAPRRELTRTNAFRGDRRKPNIPSSPHFGTRTANAGDTAFESDGQPADGDHSEGGSRSPTARQASPDGDTAKEYPATSADDAESLNKGRPNHNA